MTPGKGAAAGVALAILALFGACQVQPPVCREQEKSRLETTMAARTESFGLSADHVLTLAECEEIAIRNNLEYRVTLLETKLADEDVAEALSKLWPTGTADFRSNVRSNEPLIKTASGVPAAFEDQQTNRFNLGLLIPIFDYGATRFGWEIAKDQRAQTRLAAVRARQTLLRDVRIAYARLVGSIEEAALVGAHVEAAREELRVARSLEREGLAAGADTAFVEATLARSELELTLAGRNVLFARAALSRSLSLPTWTEYKIESRVPVDPTPPQSKEDVHALEQTALVSRPELFSEDKELRIRAMEIRQRYAEFFPRVGATFSFDWSTNTKVINPSFFTGGLAVVHSLLEGGATIAKYRKAKVAEGVEKERALLVGMSVLYEVDFRVLELIRAQDGITSGDKLVAAQSALLDRVKSGFREGLESGANVARALADYQSSRRALNTIRTEYYAAWFELEAAVGSALPAMSAASRPGSAPETRAGGEEIR